VSVSWSAKAVLHNFLELLQIYPVGRSAFMFCNRSLSTFCGLSANAKTNAKPPPLVGMWERGFMLLLCHRPKVLRKSTTQPGKRQQFV
jgi:hypothetical protein